MLLAGFEHLQTLCRWTDTPAARPRSAQLVGSRLEKEKPPVSTPVSPAVPSQHVHTDTPKPGVRATPETFAGCVHWIRAPPRPHVPPVVDRMCQAPAGWARSVPVLVLLGRICQEVGGLRSEGTFVWIEVVAPAPPARPGPLECPEVPSTQKALSSCLALCRWGHLC